MNILPWLDRQSPLAGIAVILLTFVAAGLIAAAGRAPAQVQSQPRPAYIMVFATAQPTALPTADTELADLRARVAELEARNRVTDNGYQSTENGYHVMAQPIAATPELASQVTQPAWTADPQMVHTDTGTSSQIEVPADAPRLCTGFGDWRDYDAHYASSPVCQARP